MKNKEFGSYFSLETNQNWFVDSKNEQPLINDDIALCISGRTAIFGILKMGILKNGWERVYFPQYYCHEVVDFLQDLPIEICYYSFNPFMDNDIGHAFIDEKTSVIVNVDYFGITHVPISNINNAVIIDDITYSILSFTSSTAAYCFASLRKELPVPAGGFCFSPAGHELPSFVHSAQADSLIENSLIAMTMKKTYLDGNKVDKEEFRKLYAFSEEGFTNTMLEDGALPIKALQVLKKLNVSEIIKQKHINITQILNTLSDNLTPFCFNKTSSGFGLVLYFDDKTLRDSFRQALVQAKIYPAILWPEQRHKESIKNADQMLFVHVDYRYNTDDIDYICTTLETIDYEI